MPRKAPRPCKAPRCANVTSEVYCDEHAAQRRVDRWDRRESASQRGYGAPWRKLRSRVMARDKHLCQPCAALGRLTPATEVDHILNKARGGTDSLDNLQAICTACHKVKTLREARQ